MGNKMTNERLTILKPGEFSQSDVDKLKEGAIEIVDIYESQLSELFKIQNHHLGSKGSEQQQFGTDNEKSDVYGTWVFYPWNKTLLHCVGKEELFSLRTNRNKNLISAEEQEKLKNAVIGVAGMSVGAGIATALAYSGISETIKIADFDELDTSNLNRLRESLLSVGQKKSTLARRHILELDPFIDVREFSDGINEENIRQFFTQPKLDVVVDEVDDFKMKVRLRHEAKKQRIPLLMFTSLGDNILVDVERYDTDANLQPFNGAIGDASERILKNNTVTNEDIKKYSVQIVGAEFIPTRALESVAKMGKSLVGRPQLYSTIATDGGLAAFIIRKIILGGSLNSGRYFIKFTDLFGLMEDDFEMNDSRQAIIKAFSQL
jgi:tRNA threonylcarbamoyladenosine dehydratase